MNTNQHEEVMQNRKHLLVALRKRLGPFWLLVILIGLFWGNVVQAQVQTDKPQTVKTDLTPGFVLVGDIQVPAGRLGLESTYNINLWTTVAIPYEFDTNAFDPDSNVSKANQNAMVAAMAEWEAVTYAVFRPCPNNACSGNYVHIQNSAKNNSAVGMVGGQQIINITSWGSKFIIAHELGHCLGLFHEQSRPDRDTYVMINTANIQPGQEMNFDRYPNSVYPNARIYGPYDFDSIMHYHKCEFSTACPPGSFCPCAAGTETITVLPPYTTQWQNSIGQRTHLSALDQAAISFLYPQRFLDCNYAGSNGGSNGTFRRPYTSFATALANTPAGGTLWILSTCNYPAIGTYGNQVTVKTAPGVTATLGG